MVAIQRKSRLRTWAAFLASSAGMLALLSCEEKPSHPLDNQAPSIRIVKGHIVDQDTVQQVAEIIWIGWDDDGYVDRYQVALDIPDSVLAAADSTELPIAWEDTTATTGRYLLRTAYPETALNSDGSTTITRRYLGRHTFHVRSVDNEGAVSPIETIEFIVANEMPKTTIITPKVAQFAKVANEVYVSWTGLDPDKPTPDRQPAYYEYKIFPIPSVFSSNDPQYAIDVSPGPQYDWVRVPGNVNSVRLELDPPQAYWFMIRATDYLGAVENRYESGLNAFRMEASELNVDRPRLTIRESRTGSHLFPDHGPVVTVGIFRDECIRLEFTVDLTSYGGAFFGYNVGIDVADVDDHGPGSGFIGWSLTPRPLAPICFERPGFHTITVLARDTGGATTVGTYHVNVTEIPYKDRDVLYVDDYPIRTGGGTVDAQLDTKVRNMIRAAGFRDQDIYSLTPWDANDLRGTVLPVTRADLGRYRLLVWHIEGAAGSLGNGRTALVNAIGCGGTWLTRYLQTGGALWVFGNHALAGLTPRSRGVNEGACSGNLGNDHLTGIEMDSTSFLCTFMGICGGDFRQVRTETSKTDGLLSVTPTDYGVAASLPRLEADSTAYNYAALGGIRYVDAAFAPIFGPEGLEPLYTMNPVRSTSRFKDRTLAWRYADPDPVPEHGAMAVFLFSLHEMKQGSAVDGTGVLGMARSLGDWFRRHLPPHGDPS